MDPERLLEELVKVARTLGVTVRIEPLRVAVHHASGGMIRLNGQSLVLIDAKSPLFDRVLTLADAIVSISADSADGLPTALTPEARELLEATRAKREGRARAGESRARQVRVLARPKPGLRRTRVR